MEKMDILKRIIEEDGSCCWSKPSICAVCPLSTLKLKPNGSYMSCIESLGVQDLQETAADAKYLEVASRMFLSEAIEEIIGDQNGSK